MNVTIDTLKMAKRLQSNGFTAEQAETLAGTWGDALSEHVVSKADLALAVHELKLYGWGIAAIAIGLTVTLTHYWK